MAKTTRFGGASDVTADATDKSSADDARRIKLNRPMVGGGPKLAGSNSSTSTTTRPQSYHEAKHNPRQPAPTTESPSEKEQEESSTVPSTDGSTRETAKPQSGKAVKKTAKSGKKANVRTTDDVDDEWEFDE